MLDGLVERIIRVRMTDAIELDKYPRAEVVLRHRNARYKPFLNAEIVKTENTKQEMNPAEMRKMISDILPSKIDFQNMSNDLKDLSILVKDVAKNLNFTKICSFVNIGLSCANLAVSVAGFVMVSNQLNELNAEVQKVLQNTDDIKNAQKNNRLSEYQKLIMRFNSMSSKLGRNESVPLDEMEVLLIDMRAYISEMVMNLKDKAMPIELLLKVINALVPAYTQLFNEFLMQYYVEKGELPANYNMFLDLYSEMSSETYHRIIIDHLFLEEGINSIDSFDLSNVQTLIGLNYRVQIEDQAELLTTLGSKEAIEEFDRKMDEYINSWVEENASELATD